MKTLKSKILWILLPVISILAIVLPTLAAVVMPALAADSGGYVKVEQSGISNRKGMVQIRYSFYLYPGDYGYDKCHLQSPVIPPEGYPGKVGERGNPVSQANYNKWLESLPKAWQDNPFHNHFIQVEPTITDAEIATIAQGFLKEAYADWSAGQTPILVNPSVVWPETVDNARKSAVDVKVEYLKNASLSLGYAPHNIFSELLAVLHIPSPLKMSATAIDIGGGATDRATQGQPGYTCIELANPANATGTITSFEAWFVTTGGGVKIGTASGSGTTYTTRDVETIGTVTAGSKQTFSGLNCDVVTADYLAYYDASGNEEGTNGVGGLGQYYKGGDKFGAGAVTDYISDADWTSSFYGTGITLPAAPTNVSATENNAAKVTITWTKSDTATNYRVYRDAVNASGTLGDVATYDDTGGVAPLITAGSSVASDGTSTVQVNLSLSGTSVANGTTYTYTVYAYNAAGWSSASSGDTGYRLATALTYQWNRSAADSNADYSVINGATASTYADTGAPADGSGRYYTNTLVSTGASNTPGTAANNRGYRMYVAGTVLPTEKNFGILANNTTSETGLTAFNIKNTGNVIIDITISGTDLVGGDTWTLSDNTTIGENIYGLKAGLSGGDYTIVVKKTATYNTLKSQLGVSDNQSFGLKLYTPTSFTNPADAVEKSGTVTLIIEPY